MKEFDFSFNSRIKRSFLINLTTSIFIDKKGHVLIYSLAGICNNHLAQALRHEVSRGRYSLTENLRIQLQMNPINMLDKIPILMYHEVTEDKDTHDLVRTIDPSFRISYSKFQTQMEYLFQKRYKSILPNHIRQLHKYPKEKLVVLTFDDGWSGNYSFALPILKEYGFSAVFFITVDRVGKDHFMSWDQINMLKKNNMVIASHTMGHQPLHTLSKEKIYYELYQSKICISQNLNAEVDYLSVPHGSYNNTIIHIAKEIGYKYVFTSDIVANPDERGKFILPRIAIKTNHSMKQFIRIIQQDRFFLLRLKINKKLKNILKQSLGVNNYRKAYRFIKRITLE